MVIVLLILEVNVKSTFYCSLLHVMSINTCLINRCLSSTSAVIIMLVVHLRTTEVHKSSVSRNSLYSFYSRNPTCKIPPFLRISNCKYPPPLPNSFGIPVLRTPLPFGIPKSRPWYRYGYFLELPNVKIVCYFLNTIYTYLIFVFYS